MSEVTHSERSRTMTSPKDKPAAAAIKKLLSHNPDGQRDLPVGHALWVRCFAIGFTLQKPGSTGQCLRRIGPPQGHMSISRSRDATMDGLSAVAGTPNR
jgi:hypothetical protein